jgi:regulator of sirC expression with transglutaminase-like and TPR domain
LKRAAILVLAALLLPRVALSTKPTDSGRVAKYGSYSIWDLATIPEQDIDIGYWALVIAKECDSTVDIDRYLHTLDSMAASIKYMVGPRDGDIVRLAMTKMYQFDPGEWNDNQVFSYDLDDPMGEQPGARLLSTYLDTHNGNCVSMPTLFLALMERVDPEIPFHGVAAPLHLFCRYRNRQTGEVWNVETTNGGNGMRDVWVIEQFQIRQVSIDSGVYMRDLTKKECVGELVGILVSKYRHAGAYDKALRYAELMLELNPRSLPGIVHKGGLLAWLGHALQERIVKVERRRPTPVEHRKLALYERESESYIKRAKSLGWEPETPESRERYIKTVGEAKKDNSE